MADLKAKEYQRFEDIKHTTGEGMEFWYARELAPVLEYTEWRNFNKVIDKAMLTCKNSGFEIADHFVETNKMIEIGKGGQRKTKGYMLSQRLLPSIVCSIILSIISSLNCPLA